MALETKPEKAAMKSVLTGCITAILFFQAAALHACPFCRPLVHAGIFNEDFWSNLLILLLPIVSLLAVAFLRHFSDAFWPLSAMERRDAG